MKPSPKKTYRGQYVRRETYRKRLDDLNASKSVCQGLARDYQALTIALKNYYSTHNRKFRCDCGHCIYARKLVSLPTYRETLNDLLKEKEISEKWFEGP